MNQTETLAPPSPLANLPSAPLRLVLQPLLARIVRRIAARHPDMFERLGPYQKADFLIVIREFPFALHLGPDPQSPILRSVSRSEPPEHDARIEGPFLLMLQLIDGESDGDAAFFSRDLTISGNTEAVVTLRNTLDDIDGSIAEETAESFGPPGKALLALLRRRSKQHG